MPRLSGICSEGDESESETSSPDKAKTRSGGSGWISSLITGAGSMISSILDFDNVSSPSSSNSSYSTDESVDEQADEASSKQFVELMQIVKDSEPVKDFYGRSIAIISGIESKDAIRQLLLQETFSRSEYDKLAKIIKSRVIDFPSAKHDGDGVLEDIRCKGSDWDLTFKINADSLNRNEKLLETGSVSSAVLDARKWLEQNNFASGSNHYYHLGTRDLNACLLQHDSEGVAFSPVDLAKAYMLSLQPLHSAVPSALRHNIYNEETRCEAASNSSAGLKISKRNHSDLRSCNSSNDSRRVRTKPF